MTAKRRLHVWESAHLHPDHSKKLSDTPVHIIFEDDEYDWYALDPKGLHVGYNLLTPNPASAKPFTRSKTFYFVGYADLSKVWEEAYDDEPAASDPTDASRMALVEDEGYLPARKRFSQFSVPSPRPTLESATTIIQETLAAEPEPEVSNLSAPLQRLPMPLVPRIDDSGVDITNLHKQVNDPVLIITGVVDLDEDAQESELQNSGH